MVRKKKSVGFEIQIVLWLCLWACVANSSQKAEVIGSSKDIEKISVLGTKISNRTALESTSPVDLIQIDKLSSSSTVELGQSLQKLAPSFNFSRTQISDSADIFRPATLRGLQPDQTLVLINGKRRHNQAIFTGNGLVGAGAAGTDMNAFPLSALKRVEILRDGAAARYGSDAIAGVINLTLNDSVNKGQVFFHTRQTSKGDGRGYTFGLNQGYDIGNQGGFLNLSFEMRHSDGTNRAQADTAGSSSITPGELSDSIRWRQGDPDSEFYSFFYNAMWPVKGLELYSFAGGSKRTALGNGFYRSFNSAQRNVPQVYPDGFLPEIDNQAEDISLAVGMKGELIPGWQSDASIVFGRNHYDYWSHNTINPSIAAEYALNHPFATDAMIAENAGPRSGYSGGFRFKQSTLNWDLEGIWTLQNDREIFITAGVEYRYESYSISPGELASYSCGLENGSSEFPSLVDDSEIAECGFQAYPGLRPEFSNQVSRHSKALYLDAETELSERWLLAIGARAETFSSMGDDIIWKLGSRYDINSRLSLRTTVSTGFRAPSLQQTGYTAIRTSLDSTGRLANSLTAAAGTDFPMALGTQSLTLEKAKNFNTGLIYSHESGWSFTFDTYYIDIRDRITLGRMLSNEELSFSPLAQSILNTRGAAQGNYFANSLDLTVRGVDLLAEQRCRCFDGVLKMSLAVNLNRTKVENVHTPNGIPATVALDSVSKSLLEGGQPKQRSTLALSYQKSRWQWNINFNYFGKTEVEYFANAHIGLPDQLSVTGDWQQTSVVDASWITDLNIRYKASDTIAVVTGVDNLFDRTPDELQQNEVLEFISRGGFQYPVRALPYGFNGSTYFLKLEYKI